MVEKRATEIRERAKSTFPFKVMVLQVIFKNLPVHANTSCVKPLITRGTQNGVLIASDGLLAFTAGKLYASPGWARVRMNIAREFVKLKGAYS